jgi:gluconolactonase
MKIGIAVRCTALALLAGAALPAGAQAKQDYLTPLIPDVVDQGSTIAVLKEGLEAVEGPVPTRDGALLFTNNRAGHILRITPDGAISIWREGPGGANALTWTPQGELVGTLTEDKTISVVKPGEPPRVLAKEFEGKPFNRPNDLVASKRGVIYFTDTAPVGATNTPLPSAVYRLAVDGTLQQLVNDIGRPNGVALSPDERNLYVADTTGEWIVAIELDKEGRMKGRHNHARLELPPPANGQQPTSGADGLAVDDRGRIYAATAVGVQVFAANGQALGRIRMPLQPQNLAFAGGSRRNELYVVGRGAVFRIATLTRGPRGREGK